MTSSTDHTFINSRGHELAATFTSPDGDGDGDGDGPIAGVLLCQGMSGVRTLVLPEVARRLANVGIGSLRFDYSGFGDSKGDRGWIDPGSRSDDARFALETLIAQPRIDAARIGAYGHSLGGPVAIATAAADTRITATAVVSSPGRGVDMLRAARPSWDWLALRHRVDQERARIAAGGIPALVGIAEIFPFSPSFAEAYAALRSSLGGTSAMASGEGLGVSEFYLATVDRITASRPDLAAVGLAHCATLFINGSDDDTAPIETVEPVFTAVPGFKRWILIPGADHNDLDHGGGLDKALDHVCAWFTQHL